MFIWPSVPVVAPTHIIAQLLLDETDILQPETAVVFDGTHGPEVAIVVFVAFAKVVVPVIGNVTPAWEREFLAEVIKISNNSFFRIFIV
jgi:hypothetical protein